VQLIMELFLWALQSEETIRYHHLQTDITASQQDPDAIMNDQLERLGLINGKGARYAHSTSWRYQVGRTLLTYLVWVDGQAFGQLPTRRLSIPAVTCSQSLGPLCPRPESLCEEQVLVHGLRHLRYLVFDRKDALAVKTLKNPDARNLLHCLEPAPSGRIANWPATVVEGMQVAT
jgi:hypothetical protein